MGFVQVIRQEVFNDHELAGAGQTTKTGAREASSVLAGLSMRWKSCSPLDSPLLVRTQPLSDLPLSSPALIFDRSVWPFKRPASDAATWFATHCHRPAMAALSMACMSSCLLWHAHRFPANVALTAVLSMQDTLRPSKVVVERAAMIAAECLAAAQPCCLEAVSPMTLTGSMPAVLYTLSRH